ncbi:MAG: class E sortase [Actinomycetota bacterium]|nr:class E sortase [Actinomycetota bacterium]
MESASTVRRGRPLPVRLMLVPVHLLLAPLVAARAASRRLSGVTGRLARHLPESRADLALVLATLTAIVLVGGATVAVMRTNPTPADLAFDAPTLVAVGATTTTLPPATTSSTAAVAAAAPAPQTQPIAPPKEPRAKEPIVQIGEIHIPKIGLVHAIFEGVTLTVIDQGPGHWPGSARPGQLGNAVFAGHRVTHSHPFRRIHELVPGDEVIFRTNDGVFTYHVTGSEIVTPKDVHIVTPTPDATITLFACHPPGSARQRYVVRGVFVSSTPA